MELRSRSRKGTHLLREVIRLISDKDVACYLHFACVYSDVTSPPFEIIDRAVPERWRLKMKNYTHTDFLREGILSLRTACKETASEGLHEHVLHLSGGFDSRAVLGGLVETVSPSDIDTVTHGNSKSHDFIIGARVARTAGVRHTPMGSEELEWTSENLISAIQRMHLPVPMAATKLPLAEVHRRFGVDRTYWSGYLGDALAGAHLYSSPSLTWEQAIERFVRKNRVGSSNIVPTDFDPRSVLPSEPLCDPSSITMDEQLDLEVRQRFRIRGRSKGIDSRSPFTHPRWSSFMLAAPHRLRFRKPLYKEILVAAYPQLFRLPIESNYGLGIGRSRTSRTTKRVAGKAKSLLGWRPKRGVFDLDKEFSSNGALHQAAYDAVHHLDSSRIAQWINYERLWRDHQEGKMNHAKDLLVLLSLSINFRAMERNDTSTGRT